MKLDRHFPAESLKPYVKYYVVAENDLQSQYKVFPSSGMVIGFQYKGKLSTIIKNKENKLDSAGITGISESYKIFKNSAAIGTILVYFTETGFTHFTSTPANELFNLSLSLDNIFDKTTINEVEERLAFSTADKQLIHAVEQFLISQLKDIKTDKLIIEAVKFIIQSKGTIRIKELNEKLAISQSPFEKRFRKIVGTTPKKFGSIIRFNAVLESLGSAKSLTEICYENGFFDQAHFIKNFKQYAGNTPNEFQRLF